MAHNRGANLYSARSSGYERLLATIILEYTITKI